MCACVLVCVCVRVQDAFWFMFLLLLLIFAFVIGIQNIHWYYGNDKRAQAEPNFIKNPEHDYGRQVICRVIQTLLVLPVNLNKPIKTQIH